MAISIPFLLSDTNYRLIVPMEDWTLAFDVRWNSTEEGWYMDIYEEDNSPIAINVKIVLGVTLGRRSHHEFFKDHIITVTDTAGSGLDAGFDDLGSRVLVTITTPSDMA